MEDDHQTADGVRTFGYSFVKLTIAGKIWKYPGPAGWYFVSVSNEDSDRLKAEKRINPPGYGYVPVTATLGATSWRTTLFPSKDGPYLLAIKSSVRAKERVSEGDDVEVQCVVALSDPKLDVAL
jgi:hypothetical protein